jgi:7-cyano-7-deazaguanine synthase
MDIPMIHGYEEQGGSVGKVVVLLSGGLDSTTLLAYMKYLDYEVLPFSVYYGQRHRQELRSVEQVCTHYELQACGVDMTTGLSDGPTGFIRHAKLFAGSSQTDPTIPVPHGHYEDPSMKVTVVPNRNMILLSLATAYAISNGANTIAYAAHTGDHAVYPDCRPEFIAAMTGAIRLAHYEPIELWAPFSEKTKAEIVTLGDRIQAPLHLTWSCYDPQRNPGGRVSPNYLHCGKCGTCVERIEAFKNAGVADPTVYKNWDDERLRKVNP